LNGGWDRGRGRVMRGVMTLHELQRSCGDNEEEEVEEEEEEEEEEKVEVEEEEVEEDSGWIQAVGWLSIRFWRNSEISFDRYRFNLLSFDCKKEKEGTRNITIPRGILYDGLAFYALHWSYAPSL